MAQAVACPCLRARYLQWSVGTGVVCVSSREWGEEGEGKECRRLFGVLKREVGKETRER